MRPTALILQARGTNRDLDVAEALAMAGAEPVFAPLNDLRQGRQHFSQHRLLVLAGGFSYADALGAGRLLALDLNAYFVDEISAFVTSGKPVIGICNGFQALLKAGILTGLPGRGAPVGPTLTFNASGHFECRWVSLAAVSRTCIWTRGLEGLVDCPIAHGEGNFQPGDPRQLAALVQADQVALNYVRVDGSACGGEYPFNPNGSALDIAGICNAAGNVLGLMPHPENHIHAWQHPLHTRRSQAALGMDPRLGLALFEQGVSYAAGL